MTRPAPECRDPYNDVACVEACMQARRPHTTGTRHARMGGKGKECDEEGKSEVTGEKGK